MTERDALRIKNLFSDGQTYAEIADALGVSKSSVRHTVKGHSWTTRKNKILDEDLVCEARRLARSGIDCLEIAKGLNTAYSATYSAIRGRTWRSVNGHESPVLASKTMSRYSEHEKSEIVRAYKARGSQTGAEFGREIGITPTTLSKWANR